MARKWQKRQSQGGDPRRTHSSSRIHKPPTRFPKNQSQSQGNDFKNILHAIPIAVSADELLQATTELEMWASTERKEDLFSKISAIFIRNLPEIDSKTRLTRHIQNKELQGLEASEFLSSYVTDPQKRYIVRHGKPPHKLITLSETEKKEWRKCTSNIFIDMITEIPVKKDALRRLINHFIAPIFNPNADDSGQISSAMNQLLTAYRIDTEPDRLAEQLYSDNNSDNIGNFFAWLNDASRHPTEHTNICTLQKDLKDEVESCDGDLIKLLARISAAVEHIENDQRRAEREEELWQSSADRSNDGWDLGGG